MKLQNIYSIILLVIVALATSSCSVSKQTFKAPNSQIEFYKADFEYSCQLKAEATTVRVLGINWNKLFNRENGKRNSDPIVSGLSPYVPVLGDTGYGKVSSYALYTLMHEYPGYDVVIQPNYKTKRFIIPLIYSKRSVEVTARLGKIK